METFLTCRRVAEYLRENAFNDTAGKFFEEISLEAINSTLKTTVTTADIRLLIFELPNILPLNYPAVENIRKSCLKIIPKLMETFKKPTVPSWNEFIKLQYILEMLKSFESKN
jgi:hypothetical protein